LAGRLEEGKKGREEMEGWKDGRKGRILFTFHVSRFTKKYQHIFSEI
jgi:hypothetical protein